MPKFFNATDENGDKIRSDWNVIDWRSGDLSKLDTQVCLSYESGTSAANAPFTTTLIDQPTVGNSIIAVPKLRITNASGQAGGNTRRVYPILGSECKNGEIKALFLDRYPLAGTSDQIGIGIRLTTDPANSNRPWLFMAWNDGIFAVESWINVDWNRAGATGGLDQGGSFTSGGSGTDLPGLQVWRTVNFGSKIGTAITLNIGADHGVVSGDNISIQTPEINDNNIDVTGTPDVSTITATSATSSANPIYNSGVGRILVRSVMPYYVHCRLIDTTFQVKAWRRNDAEPLWDDPNRVQTMKCATSGAGAGPVGIGRMCIYAGHLTNGSHYSDIGTVMWRSLDQ